MVSPDHKRSASKVVDKGEDEPLAKKRKPLPKDGPKTKPKPGVAGQRVEGKRFQGKPGAAKRFEGKPGRAGVAGKRFEGKPRPGAAAVNKFAGKTPQQQGPVPGEKQDWAKFKQEKKELKLKRKSSRDTYEITKEAKQIFEKLKCRRTEHKDQLVAQIFKLFSVGDTLAKVVKAHDTARVLQCMLKFATPQLRSEISAKLMPNAVEMCQSKYAQFCIQRMLKYGAPATKSQLVDSVMGHVVRLAGHNIASGLLDSMYLGGTAQQKAYMRQEFYGDLYRKAKDSKVKCLEDTYKEASNMKASILGSVKANLDHVANKNLVDSSLVHAVLLEYVRAICEDQEQQNAEKLDEIVTSLTALVPHMLSTKEGSEAAIICFYKSTPKNRRAIIKNIKEHLLKIANHEHGHVFLISLLNSLDDTKAAKKAIYDHLHGELKTLVANQYGRRVIQWLVAPGDTTCFHPGFIKTIDEGLAYGKKEKELRRQEIFEQIEAPIAEALAAEATFWLSNSQIGLVTSDILRHIKGESYQKAVEALVQVVTQPQWCVTQSSELPEKQKKQHQDVEAIIAEATKQRKKLLKPESSDEEDEEKEELKPEPEPLPTVPGIDDAAMHHILKKVLKNDSKRDEPYFAEQLIKHLSNDVLKIWLGVNRGCFVLLKLVEDSPKLLDTLSTMIKEVNSGLSPLLKKQKTPGAKLLATKLNLGK